MIAIIQFPTQLPQPAIQSLVQRLPDGWAHAPQPGEGGLWLVYEGDRSSREAIKSLTDHAVSQCRSDPELRDATLNQPITVKYKDGQDDDMHAIPILVTPQPS